MLIVGLAPAAHGANRTGRMFTGDRCGDVLYAALHRAGLASQATSASRRRRPDPRRVRITAPVHCAPPDNKPTPAERDTCAPYLARELELLRADRAGRRRARRVRLAGAAGRSARCGWAVPRPRPAFGHGAADPGHAEPAGADLLGCYHVSQQNTFTGRLTPAMLDAIIESAVDIADAAG